MNHGVTLIASFFSFVQTSFREFGHVHLEYKVFRKTGQDPWLRGDCLGPTGVINCTSLSALPFWVSCFSERVVQHSHLQLVYSVVLLWTLQAHIHLFQEENPCLLSFFMPCIQFISKSLWLNLQNTVNFTSIQLHASPLDLCYHLLYKRLQKTLTGISGFNFQTSLHTATR